MTTHLPIVTIPSPVLRKKTTSIKNPLSEDVQKIIPQMFAAMHRAKGIGLAAPQIGLSLRIAVIEIDRARYVLINPSLSALSREKILFEEGCLSIPQKRFPVIRSTGVTVRYIDADGKRCKMKATGLLAIALQHETDHLDGIVIADRYAAQKKLRATIGHTLEKF